MGESTIYNLLGAIRDFSNEVTVRALANRLDISTSTIMRCKNGVWPRSLKPSAMQALLDECRDRFFGGDGEALATYVIAYYRREGVSEDATDVLQRELERGGYTSFVAALIAQASAKRNGRVPDAARTDAEAAAAPEAAVAAEATTPVKSAVPERVPSDAQPTPSPSAEVVPTDLARPVVSPAPAPREVQFSVSPRASARVVQAAPRDDQPPAVPPMSSPALAADGPAGFSTSTVRHVAMPSAERPSPAPGATTSHRELIFALPLAVVLLMGLSGFSVAGLFAWAIRDKVGFVAISLAIALAPALCGVLVDSPLAWRAYKRSHPDAVWSPRSFARVAKYGDPEVVVPGAGRYNLTSLYLFHQPVCNLLSMTIYLAMFAFLVALPGFKVFFLEHDWVELFKIGFVAACLLTYAHMREQVKQPRPDPAKNPWQDNPDTFLPTRLHVWANAVHLVWTISLLIVMLMGYLAYGVVYARTQPMPPIVLWPYLAAVLYFCHVSASPMAPLLSTVSVGMFLPSVAATSAAFAIPALACYLPSQTGYVLCVCAVVFTALAFGWTRWQSRKENPSRDWYEAGKGFGTYALGMTVTVLALVLVGFLTSAFL